MLKQLKLVSPESQRREAASSVAKRVSRGLCRGPWRARRRRRRPWRWRGAALAAAQCSGGGHAGRASPPAPAMHAFAAPVVLLCWAALCAGEGKGEGEGGSLLVTKCCDQFTYLDLAKKVCLESPESQEDAATLFGPPLWAPEWLRGEPDLQVKYYGIPWHERELPAAWLDAEEPLGRRLLAVDADARRFVLEPFGGAVDARSVAYQLVSTDFFSVCFDATRDPRRPFVAATWLLGVALRKCCAKGALLDRGLQCSPPSEPSADPEWPVDFHQPLSALAWAPAPLRRAVPTADVYYDVKRELPGVEGAVVDADDPDAWELLFPRRSDDWLQAVRVRAGISY
ncbi:Protein of unknown function [Gryllus bimaculatus]|nr:Protein of unknown function [Gryllus bimaculatus]